MMTTLFCGDEPLQGFSFIRIHGLLFLSYEDSKSEWIGHLTSFDSQYLWCKELEETVSKMLQVRNLTYKQLERLHGRLVWFNSYIFGRSINKAVRARTNLHLIPQQLEG